MAALLFYLRGNEWSEVQMRHVMLVGMALAALPAGLLMAFNDDHALGEESEGLIKVWVKQCACMLLADGIANGVAELASHLTCKASPWMCSHPSDVG